MAEEKSGYIKLLEAVFGRGLTDIDVGDREKDLNDCIDSVLKNLSGREERVIRLRFGLEINLGGGDFEDNFVKRDPMTLKEMGYEFNVNRERIRQIEIKALRKLRHPSLSRQLRDYLG